MVAAGATQDATLEPIERASRDELSALQLTRLKWSLGHAYRNVPHYRASFDAAGVRPEDLNELADLARFPFLNKSEFREQYPFGLFAMPREQVLRIHASSGTTGKPTVVGYTRRDLDTWADLVARSIRAAGGRAGDIVHVAYGYGLFTGGLGAHYGAERLGCTVIPMSGGQTERQVQLIVDFSPSAPASFLELAIGGSGVLAADANTGRPVRVDPEPGTELPVVSGLTRISSPARDLFVRLQNRMPAALAVDGRPVDVGLLTLRNGAGAGSGAIRVDRLRLRASDPEFRAIALGRAARSVAAYVNGALWATSDSLSADSTEATLAAAAPLDVEAGEVIPIELRLVPQPEPSAASFRLGLDAAGVGVVQPGSALLIVQVSPESGVSFPAWTESGSFTPASLAESWANFPNPFAAGREATSFVYYLTGDAEVTLRIWTASGDGVATLLDRAPRAPGLHQDDLWNGRNGRGDVVRNGVYVAELIVKYADGSSERARRKVAVVR